MIDFNVCGLLAELSDEELATLLYSTVFGAEALEHAACCEKCSQRASPIFDKFESTEGPPVRTPYQQAIKRFEKAVLEGAEVVSLAKLSRPSN
jgi:hypothetical protein